MSAAGGSVKGSALRVVHNDRVDATIDVDNMASKSGMLVELRLHMPVQPTLGYGGLLHHRQHQRGQVKRNSVLGYEDFHRRRYN